MNIYLIIAGCLSAIAALLHLGCIYFGSHWYRFLGAGEQITKLAEQGSIKPTILTSGIVLILFVWALYAFSVAGMKVQLPLTKPVLCIITLVYLSRGVIGLFLIKSPLGRRPVFWLWSSLICLVFGVIHLIGLTQQWPIL
jgi:uncharacterized protein YhhL (DUF1145 family)